MAKENAFASDLVSTTMTVHRRWIAAVALLLALAATAWLSREKLIAWAYLSTMESGWRVGKLQVGRVTRTLSIKPSQRVADIGAGTGLFSRAFAKEVGAEGLVYAVDINRSLLEHIADSARKAGLSNLWTVLATGDDPMIPEPVDLIFLCDTFHHIEERGAYLKTLRRYLKPGGRLALIDYRENSPHIDAVLVPGMYYNSEQLGDWLDAAGFARLASYDFLEGSYFLVYQCQSCPDLDE